MKKLNRRDFVRFGGVSSLAIGTGIVGKTIAQEKSQKHRTFLPLVGNNSTTPFSQEYNYDITTDPSGLINVNAPTGHSFGSFSSNSYSIPVEELDSLKDSYCNEGECNDIEQETLNMSKDDVFSKMSLNNILLDIPQPLHHIVTHPISVIDQNQFASYKEDQDVSNVYSYGANLRAGDSTNQIVSPRDVMPHFPVGHPDYDQHINIPNLRGVDAKKHIGDYFVRVSLERHFIGGCIRRHNVWHAGALLRYKPTNTMLFDLHLCGWWDGWTPCLGVYNTGSKPFCFKKCSWNFWQIMFDAALLAAGYYVAGWIANAVAAFVASSGVGLLTATPGVPPPP